MNYKIKLFFAFIEKGNIPFFLFKLYNQVMTRVQPIPVREAKQSQYQNFFTKYLLLNMS